MIGTIDREGLPHLRGSPTDNASRRASMMLTLTPMATVAVRKLVADSGTDGDGGLRIAPGEPASDGPELSLRIVDAPEDRDRTVETDGVHVFLHPAHPPRGRRDAGRCSCGRSRRRAVRLPRRPPRRARRRPMSRTPA
jgi:hypothetical protein